MRPLGRICFAEERYNQLFGCSPSRRVLGCSVQNALVLILALGATPLLPLLATFLFWWVRYRHRKADSAARLTGKEVVERLMSENGVVGIEVKPANDFVGDHFDPAARIVNLSSDVLGSRSVYALAVAAHECGHALQQRDGYRYFAWWMAVAPYAHIGTFVLQVLLLALAMVWKGAIFLLVAVFAFLFLVSLLALPVEYDASRRALREIDRLGLASSPEERRAVRTVLWAAGLTYVAKAIQDLALALSYFLRTRVRA